jgi:hypothetical protein
MFCITKLCRQVGTLLVHLMQYYKIVHVTKQTHLESFLQGSKNSRNSPYLMETEVSMFRLQLPASCLYPDPHQSSLLLKCFSLNSNIDNITFKNRQVSERTSFLDVFRLKLRILCSPLPFVLHSLPIAPFMVLSSLNYVRLSVHGLRRGIT